MSQDNVFGRRRVLAALIQDGCMDQRVLDELLPGGVPIPDEDLFWDYKETLPVLPENATPDEKVTYAYKMGEVAKDIVAFYNMYGGYLVAGVRDGDRSICGFGLNFDGNDLAKKIQGATRETIDLKFRSMAFSNGAMSATLGLIYIPQRHVASDPVQFLKDAPPSKNGRRGYRANDIYMRSREECRLATTAADFALLFNRERLGFAGTASDKTYIENNLPAKDPNLIQFVGRGDQLDHLWKWFVDRYTAVKLISGPGGVGKTSVAWTFCNAVSRNPPPGLAKVVWLTAKKRTYAALLGNYIDIAHTHFSDLNTLLKAVLGELGVPDTQLADDASREDLIEECIATIQAWPCLLVVDDIDSLPNEEQYDVFRTISTIFDRVIAKGVTRARALLTARLNLSAAPGQLMKLAGLDLESFTDFIGSAETAINAPLPLGAARAASIRQLHEASGGSPLFASSILRLIALGETLSSAIRQHKGAEGEEVRRFAFERELESLTDNQLRLLFAAIHLRDCSVVDLVEATYGNRTVVRDDIGELRNYHLMSLNSPSGHFAREDPLVSVPSEISAMVDIVRKKISNPTMIENQCARMNRASDTGNKGNGQLFQRVIRYISDDNFSLAVEAAEHATRKIPKNADIWCLLGRAYLKGLDADPRKADAALRKAAELGSSRPEMLPLRIEAKERLNDWIGIVQLLETDSDRLDAGTTFTLARAFQALGDDQAREGNSTSAASYFRRGAETIQEAFRRRAAYGMVEELKGLKSDMMIAYVNAIARTVSREEEKIAIWEAVHSMCNLDVYQRSIITFGVNAALDWGNAVKRRDRSDINVQRRLTVVIRNLQWLGNRLSHKDESWRQTTMLAEEVAERLSDSLE